MTTRSVRRSEDEAAEVANEYAQLFARVYLAFHRRDDKDQPLSGPSRAVLLHLAQSGPLTVTECARHFGRAQSVVSEMIDQLQAHALLARMRDPADRRRTLVWLTDAGRERLLADQEVLSQEHLRVALGRLSSSERRRLVASTRALLSRVSPPEGKESP